MRSEISASDRGEKEFRHLVAGMQTARFFAPLAFFTSVWVTCVNRADPKSFFLKGRGSDYNCTNSNSGYKHELNHPERIRMSNQIHKTYRSNSQKSTKSIFF